MKLPNYLKTPDQIRDALEKHYARTDQPGYQLTDRDVTELISLLQAQKDYLDWVYQNGVPE